MCFFVSVSRQTPDSNFYTKVEALCSWGDVPITMDMVMVHQRDDLLPNTRDKLYGIYLRKKDRESAKQDGLTAIKEYRRNVEGIQ